MARWGRFVTANARYVLLVRLVAILALASTSAPRPARARPTRARSPTSRRAAAGVRPPRRGLRARLQRPDPDRRRRARRRAGAAARLPGRPRDPGRRIGPTSRSSTTRRRVAIVFVTPTSAPQDEATDPLVDRLRQDVVPKATAGGDAVAYVSGQTAAFKDIADRIMERLPIFLLYIIGVTFILLSMAFRSIVISATAAVTTLMSAFVGFGVLGARGAGGPPARAHRARPDRADRDVRPADRVRDPVRALDGLHGLPHEPDPGGARERAQMPRRRRARDRGDRPGDRGRRAHHGHRLRGVHPDAPTAFRRSSACCSRSRSSRTRWSSG